VSKVSPPTDIQGGDAVADESPSGVGDALSVRTQLDGILKQLDQRLNERPHRLPGEFLAELGQFAEQMDQAALFGAVQAVVRRVNAATPCLWKGSGSGARPEHGEGRAARNLA
jgi:hypothetical protein